MGELVIAGPYRYVRNPMISGVIVTLFGEALVLLSLPHLAWATAFLALNAVYLALAEERVLDLRSASPRCALRLQLARRFGEAYRESFANVPRVIPRATPWTPPRTSH